MEPDAWRTLVDRYSWLIFQWCRNSGLSHENASDVVQTILAQVAVYLPGFQKDGKRASFRRWLRTIARSQIAQFYRTHGQQPQGEGGSTAQFRIAEIPEPEEPSTISHIGPDPFFERVWELVDRLEDEFEESTWHAFWLTAVENRTSTEAADVLGISPNAVRLAKARVLQRIRSDVAASMIDLSRLRR